MSVTVQLNQGNFAIIDYDLREIFVRDNLFEEGEFLNDTGALASFAAGTLLGRLSGTGQLVVLESAAADGSQFPVGVLAEPITDLADAGTQVVSMCINGDVAEDFLVLQGGDTLDTVIADRQIRDRIKADTLGVRLVAGDELTDFDNS